MLQVRRHGRDVGTAAKRAAAEPPQRQAVTWPLCTQLLSMPDATAHCAAAAALPLCGLALIRGVLLLYTLGTEQYSIGQQAWVIVHHQCRLSGHCLKDVLHTHVLIGNPGAHASAERLSLGLTINGLLAQRSL